MNISGPLAVMTL